MLLVVGFVTLHRKSASPTVVEAFAYSGCGIRPCKLPGNGARIACTARAAHTVVAKCRGPAQTVENAARIITQRIAKENSVDWPTRLVASFRYVDSRPGPGRAVCWLTHPQSSIRRPSAKKRYTIETIETKMFAECNRKAAACPKVQAAWRLTVLTRLHTRRKIKDGETGCRQPPPIDPRGPHLSLVVVHAHVASPTRTTTTTIMDVARLPQWKSPTPYWT
jgi:hypothetical protein